MLSSRPPSLPLRACASGTIKSAVGEHCSAAVVLRKLGRTCARPCLDRVLRLGAILIFLGMLCSFGFRCKCTGYVLLFRPADAPQETNSDGVGEVECSVVKRRQLIDERH